MAKKRQPTTLAISTQPKQLSAPGGDLFNYLYRIIPTWGSPLWWEAQKWRTFVQNQPIAVAFRETLISYIQNLDWAIVARDSDMQDELKPEIVYYTKLFENTNGYYSDYDFTTHIEFILKDLLDLPFGTASEFARENDSDPNSRVLWIRPLDGGTLAPTLNRDFPVMQTVMDYNNLDPIFFPAENISRIYMSPRTEIRREGWGMAPPEKIYLAMELLWRGDKYYADLLLNTPEMGILDLGDMEKSSAEEWIKSFQDLMYGVNAFKIPVTYEHTNETKWIPFGKLPNDIMFDSITRKYATIVGAGYGMTLSDIGMSSTANGGETLAGTIRGERHTNNSGKATAKKKLISYFNKFLPETLMFKWIDYDAEMQVAQGRARLANAQAAEIHIRNQEFSPDEMRMQAIRDGLITISVPEKLDRKGVEWPNSGGSLGSNSLGQPKPASTGGHGEVLSNDKTVIRADLAKIVSKIYNPIKINVQKAKTTLNQSELKEWSENFDKTVFFDGETSKSVIESAKKKVFGAFSDKFSPVFTQKGADLTPYMDCIMDKSISILEKNAQENFILGKRNDVTLSENEYSSILESVNVPELINSYMSESSSTWLNLVTNSTVSLLKDVLLSKLSLDADNGMGDNKLEIVNEVARQLSDYLPEFDTLALEAGEKYMNDKIEMEVKEYVTGN